MLAAGDMSSDGTPVAAIVLGLLAAAALVGWVMHRSRMVQAQGRVGSQVHPDLGAVTLHDLPAPGSPPSVSVGVALAADPTGVQTLEEHG